MIIKPSRLKKGDKIGIVAPAGPVKNSELQASIKLIMEYGYQVYVSPNVYAQADYLAGDDNARLSDFHKMFEDQEIKAVLCARGGYGSLRLIDKISYDLVRRNPKILIGYSDITALLISIFQKTGLITFHGPLAKELAGKKKIFVDSLFRTISTTDPITLRFAEGKSYRKGIAEGVLIGGNLTLICGLLGTPFFPPLEKVILFIEEKGEDVYRLDRMFTQLRLSGRLRGLSAMIFGGFEDCGHKPAVEKLLMDITSDFGFPVCSKFPAGHGDENITLPIGLPALLDTGEMTLSFQQPCVKS
ncbi:MAG: LD-carboxypeptidase [Deltaproteobacteria bacterium]|nr:LD-carboxypeptidase [Deltaproteobacteria bacterium]